MYDVNNNGPITFPWTMQDNDPTREGDSPVQRRHTCDSSRWAPRMAQDERGIRSINAANSAFLRFINSTERKVDVVWMNYQGQHVKFKTLLPGTFFDANTYESHPWLFIDADTRDRLVVKSKDVYLPEPWFKQYERMPIPLGLPMRVERTKVYITIPVFPLRQRALQIVRDMLSRPEDAFKLEIPTVLQMQLARMVRDCSQTRLNSNPP